MFGSPVWRRMAAASAALTLLALAAGCGGKTSKVYGKVHAGGKAVSGGILVFAPIGEDKRPGPSVSIKVGADGTYESSKVVPGKASVTYTPPPDEWPKGVEPEASKAPPPSAWSGYVVKTREVNITPGSMSLDIEVVHGGVAPVE